MDAKQYIVNELGTLVVKFPNVRVRYEYDENALVHCIEVIPNEIYHLNDEYILWENEMTDKFIEFFPTQNICFISDDALVGIENIELTLYGKYFTPVSTVNEATTVEQEVIVKTREPLIDLINQLTFSDFCNDNKIIGNLTISGNYPSTYNQEEYSLAA
ncbi:MAG: hypothetical protein LBO74_05010 [Candidatus Symbiothrix sp.]|jgi:hypothetical protein|nr:hypothetical protein [Candidatus Symbiothrix sp.]